MKQGGAITMVSYSIGMIPLIKKPKMVFPDISQRCYADNDGALGTFARVRSYFNFLKLLGPG